VYKRQPSKQPLYEFIIKNYEEKEEETKNGKKIIYVLKQDIPTEILEEMAKIFQSLGYFDVENIITSKASSFIKKVF
jgi:hypothetical protein